MDRKAELGERLRKIEPLKEITAIPPAAERAGLESNEPLSSLETDESDRVIAEDLAAFRKAGWSFRSAAEKTESTKDTPTALSVVLEDGHAKLLADALNVRFQSDVTQDDVNAVLESYNLSVRRALGFSPNTYVVDAKSGESLDAARSLNERDDVSYAEPVFIEAISGR